MTAFSSELKRAMTQRRMTSKALADEAGVSLNLVKSARTGRHLPKPGAVVTLSEALDWPSLVTQSQAIRAATCEVCGVWFQRNDSRAKVCGRRCRGVAHARRQVRYSRQASAADLRLARSRLALHQEAVRAFCKDCTLGEGLCRDAACVLRPVSPLPLVPLRRVA